MTLDINYYRRYLNGNTDTNDNMILDLSKRYNNQYHKAISPFNILINTDRAEKVIVKSASIKKETRIVVDYSKKISKEKINPLTREMWSIIDEINIGDYIYRNIKGETKVYLSILSGEEKQDYDISFIRECNNCLNWINGNGDIITMPCIYTSPTSSMNDYIYYGDISVTNKVIEIKVQNNEETNNLKKDMEFIFDHVDKFKITNINRSSEKGLLNITMISTEINLLVDNLELNIANYTNLKSNYFLTILDANNNILTLSKGCTQNLNIELKNRNSVIDIKNNKNIFNKIICYSDNENIATIKNNGENIVVTTYKTGICNISISIQGNEEDENNIAVYNCSLNVIEDTPVNNYSIELKDKNGNFSVMPFINNTFIAQLKNNDIVIQDEIFNFTVRNKDINQAVLLGNIISTTANSCTIQCNKNHQYGILILSVSDRNNMIKRDFEIEIKSLTSN